MFYHLQTEAAGGQLVEAERVGEVVEEVVVVVVVEDHLETGTKESTNWIELWWRLVDELFFVYKLNCRKTYVSVVRVDVFVFFCHPAVA